LAALLDPDPQVQRDAMLALERMGGEAVPTLMQAAQIGQPRRRAQAIELLGHLGSAARPSRPLLTTALADPVAKVRRQAAWTLGRIGPSDDAEQNVDVEVRKALRLAMTDAAWDVRADAAWALGKIAAGTPDRQTLETLIAGLDDGSVHVRWSAVWAIARLGTPAGAAMSGLIALLEDPSWKLRASAALALSRIVDSQAAAGLLPLIERLAADRHPLVRSRAAAAAKRLRNRRELAF
jgi:HEAT repeat protein